MSTNRNRISKNEESSEDIKKSLAEATASGDMDKVIELAGQAKALKGGKDEFINKDEEEAHAENAEADMMEQAKSEDAAKTKEKEEVAKRAKELEELKLRDEAGSTEKIEEILKKINGKGVVESGKDGSQELKEALESATMELEELKRKEREIEERRGELIEKENERLNATDIPEFLKKVGHEAEEAGIGFNGVMSHESYGDGEEWATLVNERINEILEESKSKTGILERTKIKMQVANFIRQAKANSKFFMPLNGELDKMTKEKDKKQQEVDLLKQKYRDYRE